MTVDIKLPSKTTISGFLSFGIAACVALLGSGSPILTPKILSCITLALGVMKAVVGIMQKDAGEQLVQTPDGTVKFGPAHQVPDNPADRPVVP